MHDGALRLRQLTQRRARPLALNPLACASWSNLPRVQVQALDDGLQISGNAWDCSMRSEALSADHRLNARVAGATAVQRPAEVVRMAYDAAGASAVRRGGVLERFLREASC